MAQLRPEVSELIAKAMTLSPEDRGIIASRLIDSLDQELSEEGVEEAWAEEIRRRVDDFRSGKTKPVSLDQVVQELADGFPDES
jgi:putative addiction module component (TIGR02574 family)